MASILFTLICSLFAAFYFIANDVFKLRGDVFVFLRSVFLAVVLTPVMFFVEWDREASFYIIMTIACLFAGFGDVLMFEANKHYSAAAMSRVVVARNIIMFLMWPVLISGYWDRLTANTPVFTGSVILILISSYALSMMRKNPVSLAVVKIALPIMAMYVACDLLLAVAVHGRPDAGDAIVGLWIAGVTNAAVATVELARNSKREGRNLFIIQGWMKPAAVNGLLFMCVVFFKTIAIANLENPGYFGSMMAIYSFWVYLLHKYWLKQHDASDPRLGFVVVVCSILLGLLAVQIPK